jgi:hypothetical protein
MSGRHKGIGIAGLASAAPILPHAMRQAHAVHPVHAASFGLVSLMAYLIAAELRNRSK